MKAWVVEQGNDGLFGDFGVYLYREGFTKKEAHDRWVEDSGFMQDDEVRFDMNSNIKQGEVRLDLVDID